MEPEDELARSGFTKPPLQSHTIDFSLDMDMSCRLYLEVTAFFVVVEVSEERALDVLRSGIMPLYQVAVVAVHDVDEAG